nr:hypothetical protein [uncultured Rhodopila sp.]
MPIVDQRRIAFDVGALRDILDYLPQAARSVGLPGNDPTAIVIDGSGKAVRFAFGDHVVTLGAEKLAALLIAYCIRAGISIPRQMQRSVNFSQETIMLVFLTEYLAAPFPTFSPKQSGPPRGFLWNGP